MTKRIIVTGGTGNLGQPVVDRLIQEGHEIICTQRPDDSAHIEGLEMNKVDLTQEDAVKALVEIWKAKYDKVDGLLCMAGGFAMTDITHTQESDLLDMYRLNFLTTFFLASALYPWMKETGGGVMVFTGAKAALEGGGSAMIPYTLSKSAVIDLAKLMNETGVNDNILAAVIAPGTIDTPVNRQSMPEANFDRWVKPETIAEHVGFLFSAPSSVLSNPVIKLYNKS